MKNINVTNTVAKRFEEARVTFQLCDKRKYNDSQLIERLLQLASSEGFW